MKSPSTGVRNVAEEIVFVTAAKPGLPGMGDRGGEAVTCGRESAGDSLRFRRSRRMFLLPVGSDRTNLNSLTETKRKINFKNIFEELVGGAGAQCAQRRPSAPVAVQGPGLEPRVGRLLRRSCFSLSPALCPSRIN